MTIFPKADAVDTGGLMIRSAWITIPALVLYGLLAVPLGMGVDRYMATMTLFIMGAMSTVGFGMLLVEHSRFFGLPFGDGADDELADCLPGVLAQICAGVVMVGAPLLGLVIALGLTAR